MSSYCPNCVTEMLPEKKKLGLIDNWMVCPSCGVREEVIPEDIEESLPIRDKLRILRQKRRYEREQSHYISGCDPFKPEDI